MGHAAANKKKFLNDKFEGLLRVHLYESLKKH
jgi:hypothetical protein